VFAPQSTVVLEFVTHSTQSSLAAHAFSTSQHWPVRQLSHVGSPVVNPQPPPPHWVPHEVEKQVVKALYLSLLLHEASGVVDVTQSPQAVSVAHASSASQQLLERQVSHTGSVMLNPQF